MQFKRSIRKRSNPLIESARWFTDYQNCVYNYRLKLDVFLFGVGVGVGWCENAENDIPHTIWTYFHSSMIKILILNNTCFPYFRSASIRTLGWSFHSGARCFGKNTSTVYKSSDTFFGPLPNPEWYPDAKPQALKRGSKSAQNSTLQ